jgi:hypothetical protein
MDYTFLVFDFGFDGIHNDYKVYQLTDTGAWFISDKVWTV